MALSPARPWRCLWPSTATLVLLACPPAPSAPCVDDGDCQATQLCRAGQCRSACNSSLDCTRRELCVDGACLPATASDAGGAGDRERLDATAGEGGAVDALARDHAVGDAAASDATTADVTVRDATAFDAAVADAVTSDSATSDAQIADRGGGDRALQPDAWHRDTSAGEGVLGDAPGSDGTSPADAAPLDGAVGQDLASTRDASLGWDLSLSPEAAILDQGGGLDGAAGGDGGSDAGVVTCPGTPFPTRCPAEDGTLRACYTFDDDVPIPDSGTTAVPDHSAHGNHGQGRGLGHEVGVHGLAALFAGAQLVTVADDASLDFVDQVTVEAWVFPTAYPANNTRMGIVDNNAQYAIFLRPGGVLTCATNSTSNQLLGGMAPLDTWTHVACTLAGGVLRQYVNGVQVVQSSGLPAMDPGDTNPMNLGANSPDGDYLVGRLDTVRVWSRALTPGEICWAARRP